MQGLSATALKHVLWQTLNDIRDNKMLPGQGDAIATQAREILRVVKMQLQIAGQSKRKVSADVLDFSERRKIIDVTPAPRELPAPKKTQRAKKNGHVSP